MNQNDSYYNEAREKDGSQRNMSWEMPKATIAKGLNEPKVEEYQQVRKLGRNFNESNAPKIYNVNN
jgi:hypothetical protein